MHDFDQFERRLAAALRSDADRSLAPFEPQRVARAAIAASRRRSGPMQGRSGRGLTLLAAAALLLVGGAMAAGSGLVRLPSVVPPVAVVPTPPSAELSASPTLSPAPSATAVVTSASGMIAYTAGGGTPGSGPHVWVAKADGTGAREVAADLGGCQSLPSWSPDGSRLLFTRIPPCLGLGDFDARLYLADATGGAPQLLDTGCVRPCVSDSDGVFSADGRQVLFLRENVVDPLPSATLDPLGKPAQPTPVRVLASLDLATGVVTELGIFVGTELRWSPDRTQIVLDQHIGPTTSSVNDLGSDEVLVAGADGRNAQRVSPAGWESISGAWSPDGASIVFQRNQYTWIGNVSTASTDLYTVRPDGTGLRRLTTDGTSNNPAWGVDGRIWFIRTPYVDTNAQTPPPRVYWIMDADGGNATQSTSAPQLWQLADTARQPTP